jgi:hypothetical protein
MPTSLTLHDIEYNDIFRQKKVYATDSLNDSGMPTGVPWSCVTDAQGQWSQAEGTGVPGPRVTAP